MPYTYSFNNKINKEEMIYSIYPLKSDINGTRPIFEHYFDSLPIVPEDELEKDNILPGINFIRYDSPQNISYTTKVIKINDYDIRNLKLCIADYKKTDNIHKKCDLLYNMCLAYGNLTIQLLLKKIEGLDFSILKNDEINEHDKAQLIIFRKLLIAVFLYDDIIDTNRVREMNVYYYVVRYISNKFCLSDEIYDLSVFE